MGPWGPVGGRNAIVCGAWFMLREVELSTLRACLVSLDFAAPPVVAMQLPASKSDTSALGVSRAHARICGQGPPRPDCPTHAAWDQRLVLDRFFGGSLRVNAAGRDFPFFLSEQGKVVTKAAMTETILFAARWLRAPLANADRTLRVSGHTLRPTGAQGLAELGLDAWAIELLGRWGGATVRKYIREAAVTAAAAGARTAATSRTLPDLAAAARASAASQGPAASTEDARAWLQEHVPGYLSNWRASLLDAVRNLMTRAVAQARVQAPPGDVDTSSSSGSSSASSDETAGEAEVPLPPSLLRDEVSSRWHGQGKRHIVAAGPPEHEAAAWVTACGWRFGLSGNILAPNSEHPLCLKCAKALGG